MGNKTKKNKRLKSHMKMYVKMFYASRLKNLVDERMVATKPVLEAGKTESKKQIRLWRLKALNVISADRWKVESEEVIAEVKAACKEEKQKKLEKIAVDDADDEDEDEGGNSGNSLLLGPEELQR
jgi:hypothetical protein